MADGKIISTAAKPDDLEKAYRSALKAMSVLGIDMTTKKPNAAVIGAFMTKNKKAEFKLSGDKKTLKLVVECDGNVNTLGALNVAAEKEAEKQKAIMRALVECGLATKADLDKLEKETAPAKADPKVIANIDRKIEAEQKKIADAKKVIELFQKVDSYDKAVKVPAVLEVLEAAAKAEHSTENLLFLKAEAANTAREKMLAGFIMEGSKFEINIDAPTRKGIIAGTTEMDVAVNQIKALVSNNALGRARKAQVEAAKKIVEASEKVIEALEAEKKKLTAT